MPQVQKLTDKRNKAIDNFLKEFTKEQFKQICQIANSTNFLIGKNDKGWKADFDFLMRIDKATSILEGKYKNIGNQNGGTNGQVTNSSGKYSSINFEAFQYQGNDEKIDDTDLI